MRRTTVRFASLGVSLLCLSACTPPESTHHTVPEYRADAALRARQLAECANDPGGIGRSPDCINAREARRQEEIHSLRDLPPVGLLHEGKPDHPAPTDPR